MYVINNNCVNSPHLLVFSLLKVHLQLRGLLKRQISRYVINNNSVNSPHLLVFSLLKVHLQLRGFTVFIDIEQLRAGKFDERLLDSVRHANSFIIILTPNALDRCIGDDDKKDWVHKVRAVSYTHLTLPTMAVV